METHIDEIASQTAVTPETAPAIRRLAELPTTTLALMRGPAFADAYATRRSL